MWISKVKISWTYWIKNWILNCISIQRQKSTGGLADLLDVQIKLTHWGRGKIVTFSQTFSNALSWIICFVFLAEYHRNKFPGSKYQYASIGWGDGLAPNRQQSIIWTNVGLVLVVYWCMCAIQPQWLKKRRFCSFWLIDAVWHRLPWSTPSHNLNQHCLTIS